MLGIRLLGEGFKIRCRPMINHQRISVRIHHLAIAKPSLERITARLIQLQPRRLRNSGHHLGFTERSGNLVIGHGGNIQPHGVQHGSHTAFLAGGVQTLGIGRRRRQRLRRGPSHGLQFRQHNRCIPRAWDFLPAHLSLNSLNHSVRHQIAGAIIHSQERRPVEELPRHEVVSRRQTALAE